VWADGPNLCLEPADYEKSHVPKRESDSRFDAPGCPPVRPMRDDALRAAGMKNQPSDMTRVASSSRNGT